MTDKAETEDRTARWRGAVRARAARAAAWVATAAAGAVHVAGTALAAVWRALRPVPVWALQVVLALLILLEEWGWEPLAQALGRLARWRPWARLEAGIARLPPYPALAVFALPTTLLLPLKFLALFLIAKGQLVLAGLLFAAAKIGATALVARLFLLTRPALMRIAWFAWAYERFIPWKNALEGYVRSSYVWRVGRVWKARIKQAAAERWRRLRPRLSRLRQAARAAGARLAHQARRVMREVRTRWAAWQR